MSTSQQIFQHGTQPTERYARALDAIYRTGLWLPDQGYAEAQDVTTWEKLRRDPVCSVAIQTRLNKVAGKETRVLAASKEKTDQRLAGIVEAAFQHLDGHTAARRNVACAIFRGRSYGYVNWRRMELDVGAGLAPMLWAVPVAIEDIDPRMVRFVPERTQEADGSVKMDVYAEMWSIASGKWARITPETWQNFVSMKYEDEQARLGQGRGLIDALYFYAFAKGIVLREGLQGLERWAQGTVLAKIDGLRAASETKTNTNQVDLWSTAIKGMRSGGHELIFDKQDDVSVVETSGTGHQLVMSMLSYLDGAMVRAAAGSLLPSGGGGSAGSYGRAEVEAEQTEDLVQYDRAQLDEVFTRDLVGQFLRLNRPQIAACGLLGARRPMLRGANVKKKDPESAARVISTALQAGVKLRADEVYESLGFTPPTDEDTSSGNVIEGGAAVGGGGWNPLGGNPDFSRTADASGPGLLDQLRRRAAAAGAG